MDQRKQRGEKTKKRILDATKTILDLEGYPALSTRSIALKAGVSQSSLYHHFKDLDEILFATLSSAANRYLDYDHIDQFDSLIDYFINLIEYTNPKTSQDNNSACFFSIYEKAMVDERFRKKLVQMGKDLIGDLKKKIRLKYGKNLDERSLDLIVFGFITFREGFVVHTQLFKDESPFEDLNGLALDIFHLFQKVLTEKNAYPKSHKLRGI
ncbi:MAG: TetR/AcrR family transcriptional regulator [Deltaproteobacteria bacterium]|nr:TetR/AcrR family transcriptional regulator [Deltaproteobacteria bacterium]